MPKRQILVPNRAAKARIETGCGFMLAFRRRSGAVPAWERLTVSRNGWSAAATHVWTGAAWVPLVPGPVRVPAR